MVSVRYEKVTKRYDDGTEAVKELDLEVADGEFLVLLGPSGCGKQLYLIGTNPQTAKYSGIKVDRIKHFQFTTVRKSG